MAEEVLNFQIDADSSDQRHLNPSSTAGDNFHDLAAFSSQGSSNLISNGGVGDVSPMSQKV